MYKEKKKKKIGERQRRRIREREGSESEALFTGEILFSYNLIIIIPDI